MSLMFMTVIFSGCYYYDINHSSANIEFLTDKNENLVLNCNVQPIAKRGQEIFWKQNNLPKGTTEFVCKDGKAYLSNTLPSD